MSDGLSNDMGFCDVTFDDPACKEAIRIVQEQRNKGKADLVTSCQSSFQTVINCEGEEDEILVLRKGDSRLGDPDSIQNHNREMQILADLKSFLTSQSFRLVEYLFNNPGFVPYEELIERVWGKQVQYSAVKKAIDRTKKSLADHQIFVWDLTIKDSAVKLSR